MADIRKLDRIRSPRAARWMLRLALPRAQREFFLGDLEEDFFQRVLRQRDARAARSWYWRQALDAALGGTPPRDGGVYERQNSGGIMGNWGQDVRFALRALQKNPGFALVAVLTLALGIGANTAIFTVVNALLISPLPFPQIDRVVQLHEQEPSRSVERGVVAPANFADWKAQSQSFAYLAALRGFTANLSGDIPERLSGSHVTPEFFDVMGIQPAYGRAFLPEEAAPGKENVVVLSYGVWQRLFGGKTDVVGKAVTINGIGGRVVGIMPEKFNFPPATEIWAPLALNAQQASERGSYFLQVVGRLKPGVALERARLEMATIAQRLEKEYPKSNTGRMVFVSPLLEETVRFLRPALLVLMGAVGFVLLIACANVANLLLARASAREREIAVRAALGAGGWRIARQLLTESILLGALGGAAGLLLAVWGVGAMKGGFPGYFARFIVNFDGIQVNPVVLLFVMLLSIVTGVLFGVVPALQSTHPDLNSALKEGAGKSGGPRRGWLRSSLVVFEVAFSLVLLAGAGLMIKSFAHFSSVDMGFDMKNVLMMRYRLPAAKYGPDVAIVDFHRQVLERVAQLPGVESVSLTNYAPMDDSNSMQGLRIEGEPEPQPGKMPVYNLRTIGPAYFSLLHIPLIAGREINERDTTDAPPVVLVNEAFVARHYAGQEAIGKRIAKSGEKEPWHEIVGVVRNFRNRMDSPAEPEVYFPYTQEIWRPMTIMARTRVDAMSLAGVVRGVVLGLDANQPVYNVRTMEGWREQVTMIHNFSVYLLSIFSGVALVMASVGLYGVLSYSVAQQTHEIGVRMALGAERGDVLRWMLGQGLKLSLAGLALGLLFSFVLTRAARSLLNGVSPTDPMIFATVSLVLLAAALLATFIPSWRATRVDPLIALRHE